MDKPLTAKELKELIDQPICWLPPQKGPGTVMHKVGFLTEFREDDHAAQVAVPLPSGAFYYIVIRADSVRPDPRFGFRRDFEQVFPPATTAAKLKEKAHG